MKKFFLVRPKRGFRLGKGPLSALSRKSSASTALAKDAGIRKQLGPVPATSMSQSCAKNAGIRKQLAGIFKGERGDRLTVHDAGKLGYPPLLVERFDLGKGPATGDFLFNQQMMLSISRHLRKMSHTDDLSSPGGSAQLSPYLAGGASADSGVNLVEDQCPDLLPAGEDPFDSQQS